MSAPSTPAPPSPAPPSPPDRWYPAVVGECPPLPEVSGSEHPSSEPAESDTSVVSGCSERVCKGGCKRALPISHFHVFRTGLRGNENRSYVCKLCVYESGKVVKELRKVVGPPPDKCELCGRVESLHLDHDHITHEFRGWLCRSCNTSLGGLGDNVEGLLRAIAYLERPRSSASSSRASPY